MNKTKSLASVIALVGLVSFCTAADQPAAAPKIPDTVATVNGKPITRQQLEDASRSDMMQLAQSGQQLTPDQMLGFQRQILGRIVEQELLEQAASKTVVPDVDKQVDEQVAKIKGQFPNEQAFNEQIAKAGRTVENLKSDVRRMVTVRAFIEQQFGSKIKITDEQVKSFYDQNPTYFQRPESVRASHILVTVPATATDADKKAKKEAIDKARERVTKGGEDFGKVAKEVSDCPSKANGGDLDFFSKGQMVPEFEQAVFAMKVGDVSDVVTTKFGFHVIKKTGEQPADKKSLDQSKELITRFLKEREERKQVGEFIAEQQKTAKIETFLK